MFLGNPPNQNGMRKLSALPFILIALSASCITTEVVPVASTEAPVRAEMVVKKVQRHLCTTAWGGACSFQESAILLHTGPLTTREFGYGCTMTDGVVPDGQVLTNTGDGIRMAFRCGRNLSWNVVFVGGENRSFLDCKKYDFAGEFRWDTIPTFKDSAARIMGGKCGTSFADLAEEVKARHGQSAVTDLLIATIGMQAARHISYDRLQAWDDVYVQSPAGEKSRLAPEFRRAILSDSPVLALERAVRYADLSDPEFLPALITRMEKIVSSPPHYDTDSAAEIILRKIATVKPDEAARLACREMEREKKRGAITYLAGALLAVANGNYSCPVVLSSVEDSNCDASFYCASGRICEPAELEADIKKALHGAPDQKLSPNLRDRALLAAALRVEGSADVLKLWHERHSYQIDQPAEPACSKLYMQGQKGAACHCFDKLPSSACARTYGEPECKFRVNDAEKKIDQVVSP
jgi:hypothetical protein